MRSFTLSAMAIFYFQWHYCALLSALNPNCKIRVASFFWVLFGALQGALFAVFALFGLHVGLVWPLFSLFILIETMVFFQNRGRVPFFFALFAVYCILSVNLFLRCLCAILSGQPPSLLEPMFSLRLLDCLPLALGFFIAGAGFHWARQHKNPRSHLLTIVQYPRQVLFVSNILMGLLLCLLLNLWFYSTGDNHIAIKLWGIKTTIFGAFSLHLGLSYAFRVGKLADYRQNSRKMQQALLEKERQARQLSQMAFQDSLTGCYNRITADRVLATLFETRAPFTLCFLDLDCLKQVNDAHGHNFGDRYLCDTADALRAEFRRDNDHVFRYGGDEFLLLLHDVNPCQANELLCRLSSQLSARGVAEGLPFPMSFSFGAADSRECSTAEDLLRLADQRMYLQKRIKKAKATGERPLPRETI